VHLSQTTILGNNGQVFSPESKQSNERLISWELVNIIPNNDLIHDP